LLESAPHYYTVIGGRRHFFGVLHTVSMVSTPLHFYRSLLPLTLHQQLYPHTSNQPPSSHHPLFCCAPCHFCWQQISIPKCANSQCTPIQPITLHHLTQTPHFPPIYGQFMVNLFCMTKTITTHHNP